MTFVLYLFMKLSQYKFLYKKGSDTDPKSVCLGL